MAFVSDKRPWTPDTDRVFSYDEYCPPGELKDFLPEGTYVSEDFNQEFRRLWREKKTGKRTRFEYENQGRRGSEISEWVQAERMALNLCLFDQPPNPSLRIQEPEPEPRSNRVRKTVTFTDDVEIIPVPPRGED